MYKRSILVSLALFCLVFLGLTGRCFADAASQFEQAETYRNNGNYLQSEEAYETIIQDYPGSEQRIDWTYEYLERYVDQTDGDNSDLGTASCPLKTIQAALNQIPHQGTIFIAGCEDYNENIMFPTSKDVTVYGQCSQDIEVHGTHTPSSPPSNITCIKVYFVE